MTQVIEIARIPSIDLMTPDGRLVSNNFSQLVWIAKDPIIFRQAGFRTTIWIKNSTQSTKFRKILHTGCIQGFMTGVGTDSFAEILFLMVLSELDSSFSWTYDLFTTPEISSNSFLTFSEFRAFSANFSSLISNKISTKVARIMRIKKISKIDTAAVSKWSNLKKSYLSGKNLVYALRNRISKVRFKYKNRAFPGINFYNI